MGGPNASRWRKGTSISAGVSVLGIMQSMGFQNPSSSLLWPAGRRYGRWLFDGRQWLLLREDNGFVGVIDITE